MPILTFNNNEAISPQSFLGLVDSNLDEYLTVEVSHPEGREHGNDEQAGLLRKIFTERKRFSTVLRAELDDIDWASSEPVEPEQFVELCKRSGYFADKLSNDAYKRLNALAKENRSTVMAVAGAEILDDENITQDHMYILCRFGDWLKNKFVTESETKEGRNGIEQFESQMSIRSIIEVAAASIAMEMIETSGQSSRGKSILHSLVKLIWSDTPVEQVQQLIQAMEDGEGIPDDPTYTDLQDFLERVIKEHVEHIWIEEVGTEQFRVVNIGIAETPSFQLLPVDNFYFQPTIAEAPEMDHIQPEGNLHRSYDDQRLRDVSLFNSLGEKVTWGDLSDEEIAAIQGPYYVLGQGESYHDVPEWAVLPESTTPSIDVNRPQGLLDEAYSPDKRLLRLSYVKAFAKGKIDNGVYIDNPKEIAWSEGE